jgi:hypothetical protein
MDSNTQSMQAEYKDSNSIYSHLDVGTTPGEFLIEETPTVTSDLPTKDILVNWQLDQDEGLAPGAGRYRIFYNLYFVHRQWLYSGSNYKKLAAKFPAFALCHLEAQSNAHYGNLTNPNILLDVRIYPEEFISWVEKNMEDYMLMIPIIKIRNRQYRFAGVRLPAETASVQTPSGGYGILRWYDHFPVKNVCIYGAWLDYPTNGKLFNRGSTNDKKRLKPG